MIFGFNTDVKHDGTVYHVQSETGNELLLQTQVLVRGRCIGKRAISYADKAAESGFADQQKRADPAQPPASSRARLYSRRTPGRGAGQGFTPEALAAIKELDVHWLNAASVHAERNLILHLRVTEGGTAVEGARLTVGFARPGAAPFYTQVATGSDGDAELKIDVDESSLPDSAVLVQANSSGRTTTRKFHLRKVEA